MEYSNPIAKRLRKIGRRLHILRPIVQVYRHIRAGSYEDAFQKALMGAIRVDDTVWDVGANDGVYTQLFADKVGTRGKVVAFEPSPRSFANLRLISSNKNNILLQAIALSDVDGEMPFFINNEHYSKTDSLRPLSADTISVRVTVKCADSFLPVAPPDIIKIDVEGFELDVLKGMANTLSSVGLRAVFIEVHFSELERRGVPDAPAVITRLLRDKGFVIHWTDPSHIFATRKVNP
jgi:FkbM family methyltransferase